MCGRYSLTTPEEALRRTFGYGGTPRNLQPRYNIAPTQEAPVVRRAREGGCELVLLRWGLVPYWSKGPHSRYSMINARADSLQSKPAYREAFARRRCLVPADGFYEWVAQGGKKQPYRIVPAEGEVFALAGLWERWKPPAADAPALESFTIAVTEANAALAAMHDRMPVILAPADWERWLDPATPAEEALALLRPAPDGQVRFYPVSPRVNTPANDDPSLLEPLAGFGAQGSV